MNINNDLTNNPQEHQFTEVVDIIVQSKTAQIITSQNDNNNKCNDNKT